jgi:hypothetical protein
MVFRTFLVHLSCIAPQPVLQAIQLGTADNSIRFRAKTVGIVEKVLGVDKDVASATSAPGRRVRVLSAFEPQTVRAEQLSLRGGQFVWPDLRCDRRDGGRSALA